MGYEIPAELIELASGAAALAETAAGRRAGAPRVLLALDDEQAGVVMDALIEHQRFSARRHAEAVARGDTVSTTSDRAATCVGVLEQLIRQTT